MKLSVRRLAMYSSGMIGDFLMLLNVADNSHEFDHRIETYILVSRNSDFFKELISNHYPYVHIISLKPRALREYGLGVRALARLASNKTAFLLPMLFIGYPLRIFLLGWLLTRMPGSKFFVYSRNVHGLRKLFVDEGVVFDPKKPYFRNLSETIEQLGWECRLAAPRFSYTPSESPITGTYVVMHINGSRKRHSFPLRRWKEVVILLKEQVPGIRIFLTGAKNDHEANDALAAEFPDIIFNKAGEFSPSELVALIHHAKLYIGVDTGVSHLAAMMGQRALIMGHGAAPTMLQEYGRRTVVLRNKEVCICGGELHTECITEESGVRYMRCLLAISNEMMREGLAEVLKK